MFMFYSYNMYATWQLQTQIVGDSTQECPADAIVVSNKVANSVCTVFVLSLLFCWLLTSFCLVNYNVWQSLLAFQNFKKAPKIWVWRIHRGNHFPMPSLNYIVCFWHFVCRPFMHIPQIMTKKWPAPISTPTPTNLIVFKVVNDRF